MIDYAQAEANARRSAKGAWHYGTFMWEKVWQDEEAYCFVPGAREWVVERNPAFMILDVPYYVVEKRTGVVTKTTYLLDPDRFDNMVPAVQ